MDCGLAGGGLGALGRAGRAGVDRLDAGERRQRGEIGLAVAVDLADPALVGGLDREQVINDVLLAAQPTKRFVTPEEIAATAVFLCRDEARSITGANLSVDGGWTAA